MPLSFRDRLVRLGACGTAVAWVGNRTASEALRDCQHADWMLWLIIELGRQRLATRLAAGCAREVLPNWIGNPAPLVAAIEAAERWAADPNEANRLLAAAATAAAESAEWAPTTQSPLARAAATAARLTAVWAAWGAWMAAACGATAWEAEVEAHKRMCDMIRNDPEVQALVAEIENQLR